MIKVRYYRPEDDAAIERMHAAQGFSYPLPQLNDPNFMVRSVLEGDSGQVEMAVLLCRTAETYLLMDPDAGTKKEKLGKLLLMKNEVMKEAKREGLKDTVCWLPPQIEKQFGPLLVHLGWTKSEWPSYYRKVD